MWDKYDDGILMSIDRKGFGGRGKWSRSYQSIYQTRHVFFGG